MLLTLILLVLAIVYAGRVAFFAIGFLRERRRWIPPSVRPFVSVIVPARNEEGNIERCVRSLLASKFPRDRFELVVVDDRSTDGTASVLDRLASEVDCLKVIHRTGDAESQNLRGKAGALQHGVEESRGEIVLFTDADCVVSANWIDGMVAQFQDEQVGLVSGLTSVSGDRFFQRIQDVEWTYTQTMATGGVGNGSPLGCFGNNMAVRRTVFDELGGYHSIAFSITEDMALQLAIFDAGYRVRHAVHPDVHVETLPCASFGEYVRQRHRWVRGGTGLGTRAAAFVATSLALWTGVVISVATASWWALFGFVCMRLLADSMLVAFAAITMKRRRLLPSILPSMVLLVLTELFIPFLATRKRVTWKGQVFHG